MSIKKSPVYNVIAVPVEKVQANDYNPNVVAPPEMRLLELSIWEDGFTMPCVCYYDKEKDVYILVDGFHRYSVLKTSKRIFQRENGMLPIVVIEKDLSNRMSSTIRHNRARGTHNIELMCHIVAELDKAGMSYGVLGGNHDVAAGLADYENYYKYFGENRFKSQNTYGESYKNNKGHYDLISEGGQDFIIVYMSWNIYQEEIDWMNQVLQQYSDRKAILCFHTYTNVKQSSGTYLDYYGQLVQKNVVAKNPNVFAVLNGHYHGSSYETVMFDDDGDGKNDRTVYQICTDYQSGFEGGNEYIKFLYFDLDNNKIYMNSYSPCMDDFNYYDTDVHTLNVEGASATGVDEMVLDVEFNTNEQTILEKSFNAYVYTNEEIGTANVDSSTGKAVLQVNNLEANTGYKWYAVVTNAATGVKRSGVYEFTTAKKNTDVITDDSQDTSDKSGNIIATGDNARIWIYILAGMSAIAVGIVSVKKKKEA